jgi:ADP-ribosylglycohydrolase
MNSKIKEAVMASFVADALSLGVHWVYNTSDIDKRYGRLDAMVKPEMVPYHKARDKGEFTHYGDQMMVLLESVTQQSGFDLSHFSLAWQKMFQTYKGYMDHATKETLANFGSGKNPEESGSLSLDLSGASRIAPLALYCADDVNAFVDMARAQAAMTHNQAEVIECAAFFAGTCVMVLAGTPPLAALEKNLDGLPGTSKIKKMVTAGVETRLEDTRKTIAKFGQMCSVEAALPSTIHLIAKYEDNLKDALIENIMAGGDCAARGLLAGFILGCYQGLETLPKQWLDDMPAQGKILQLVGQAKKG